MLTTDQAIAVVTGAAALVTAIATLLTVREMGIQREASQRPDLVPVDEFLRGVADSTENLAALRWFRRETGESPERWSGITFFNLGAAPAKNVKAKWNIDVESCCKVINELAQRTLTPLYVKYSGEGLQLLSIEGKNVPAETHSVKNQLSDSWPYVLPASLDSTGLLVPVPPFFLRLYSLGLALESRVSKREGARRSSLSFDLSATLELGYSDLGGSYHSKHFQLPLSLSFAKFGPVDSDIGPWVSECVLKIHLRETKS